MKAPFHHSAPQVRLSFPKALIPSYRVFPKVIGNLVRVFLLIAFLLNSVIGPLPTYAEAPLNLPIPGSMVKTSERFEDVTLKGLGINVKNPLELSFYMDQGNSKLDIKSADFKETSSDLIKYFLAALTVPEDEMWVNLSPYEKNRIIPKTLGTTRMGRDMLAQDYILKQLTASLVYPKDQLGKEFWGRVYGEAKEKYGDINIPVSTFNKVWIIPDKAELYQYKNRIFVVNNHLKVLTENDYLALEKNAVIPSPMGAKQSIDSNLVREILIPAIEKEVNEGKNFAKLRQIYSAMILATWYKRNLKKSILNQVYVNKNKVGGLSFESDQDPEYIYQQYLKAFKKGAFNLIEEELDPATQELVARKYFSGGLNGYQDITLNVGHNPGNLVQANLTEVKSSFAMTVSRQKEMLEELRGYQVMREKAGEYPQYRELGYFTEEEKLQLMRMRGIPILRDDKENMPKVFELIDKFVAAEYFKTRSYFEERFIIFRLALSLIDIADLDNFKELVDILDIPVFFNLSENRRLNLLEEMSKDVLREYNRRDQGVLYKKYGIVRDFFLRMQAMEERLTDESREMLILIFLSKDVQEACYELLNVFKEQGFSKEEINEILSQYRKSSITKSNLTRLIQTLGLPNFKYGRDVKRRKLELDNLLFVVGQLEREDVYRSFLSLPATMDDTFTDEEYGELLNIVMNRAEMPINELLRSRIATQEMLLFIGNPAFKSKLLGANDRKMLIERLEMLAERPLDLRVLGGFLKSKVFLDSKLSDRERSYALSIMLDIIKFYQEVFRQHNFSSSFTGKAFKWAIEHRAFNKVIFEFLWDYTQKHGERVQRLLDKQELLSWMLRNSVQERQFPYAWLKDVQEALKAASAPEEAIVVAAHLIAMASLFPDLNSELAIQSMIYDFANQFDGVKLVKPAVIIDNGLKVFKFGDRNFIRLLPKPADAKSGYFPRFEIEKQFLSSDVDNPQRGVGLTAELNQLPVLAQLHDGRVEFIGQSKIKPNTVIYQADYRLFLYSVADLKNHMPKEILISRYKETLALTLSQIYALWRQGKAHTAVSRLMHADRNGDHRPFAYWSEVTLDFHEKGQGPGANMLGEMLTGSPRVGGFIRDMDQYMGLDSNIRLGLGLVDAEHIVDTEEPVYLWRAFFDMVMNFAYAGVVVQELSNEEMLDIFGSVNIKHGKDVVRPGFRDQEALITLFNAMREHVEQIGYADYGAIKKYIEFSLPVNKVDVPDAIVLNGKEYEIGVRLAPQMTRALSDGQFTAINELGNGVVNEGLVRRLLENPLAVDEILNRPTTGQVVGGSQIVVPGTAAFEQALNGHKDLRRLIENAAGGVHAGLWRIISPQGFSRAMTSKGEIRESREASPGGIDFNASNLEFIVQNAARSCKDGDEDDLNCFEFKLPEEQLRQMQSSLSGVTPVIISIQSVNNINELLGV